MATSEALQDPIRARQLVRSFWWLLFGSSAAAWLLAGGIFGVIVPMVVGPIPSPENTALLRIVLAALGLVAFAVAALAGRPLLQPDRLAHAASNSPQGLWR